MVTNDERAAFSRRLNQALDAAGIPPKSKGRQGLVGEMFGVSQKGARKWLEGEAIPSMRRIPQIADTLGISAEWLLTGRRSSSDAVSRGALPDNRPAAETRLFCASGPPREGVINETQSPRYALPGSTARDERAWASLFRELSPANRALLLAVGRALIAACLARAEDPEPPDPNA